MRRALGFVLHSLFLVALTAPGSYGQGTPGLSGVVQDPTGTVLPRATVTVTCVKTGESHASVTDDAGRYLAPDLVPGTYEAKAELAGFKAAIRTGIPLRPGERVVANLTLQPVQVVGPPESQPPQTRLKEVFGQIFAGDLELGGRTFPERPLRSDRGKFEEYRDIPRGLFLQGLRLRLDSKDGSHTTEFRARGVGQRDQKFLFWSSKPGLYELDFVWDQVPHVFSNTGQTLYAETSRGVFELDDAMQAAVQAAPDQAAISALLRGFLTGAHDVDLRMRVDRAPFVFKLTPTPDWDVRAEYTRLRKEGNRPIGAMTGYPNEVPEPIEQTAHDLQVTTGVAKQEWQLEFSYHPSFFQNDLSVLVWDTPLRVTDSTSSGPARGRHALAPSNSAHTASVTGAVSLPSRSRFTGTFSYGLRSQNAAFIPHTINSALSSPDVGLPADSLEGNVHTRLLNLRFTSRPLRRISVGARYRLYDFDDRTPSLTLPGWVSTDFTLRTGARGTVTSTPFNYTKQSAGSDLVWRLRTPLSLKVGYEWERLDRDERVRAVPVSDEHTPKISLDYTPFGGWLRVQASYAHSWRRVSAYNTYAHLASTVTPAEFARLVPNGTSQSPLLRMYDQADRDRDRVDFLAELTFRDTLTFTPTVSFRNDDYRNSLFGLQHDKSWAAGTDMSWSPLEAVSFFASYMREHFLARQRSRYRPFLPDFTPRVDNPTYDWVANNEDTVDTVVVGSDTDLIPERLDFHLAWTYSQAIGRMRAFNPVTPAGGTADWDAAARARDFPDISDPFTQLDASVRYRFKNEWFARLRYLFEKFDFSDFRTDDIQPYMGDIDPVVAPRAVYLGAQIRPYTAHVVAFSIGYQF